MESLGGAAALAALADLRKRDLGRGVLAAYLAAHPKGDSEAVRDLARSLHLKLDRAALTAAESVRRRAERMIAHVDARGTEWVLGHYSVTVTSTLGRRATSQGAAERVGEGNTVTVEVGGCGWCQEFAGEAVIGQDPLPPYHANCTCTAA